MIIIYLKGGLGNQMFQYAMGRCLAESHKTQLKMDISAYNYDGPLEYFLGPFNIQENFASPEEIKKLTTIEQNEFQRIVHSLFHSHPKKARTLVRENRTIFNKKMLNLPDNVYLEGYWQSEKYFLNIENIIRKEFTIKTPQTGKNKELSEIIAASQSVSIHIRRGDYVSSTKTNQTHGTCELDYYDKCINELKKTIKKPHFFIFSNDIPWCRKNLKMSADITFVEHNTMKNAHEDLRLMSQCKHNIISNSSFSWWAAWLNTNENKLVFAPQKWFANKKKNADFIVPEKWIRK